MMEWLASADGQALFVTLRLATLTTLLLLVLATPLAWWLARTHSPARVLVQAATSMPLVLPPTVLGFYVLVLLGPDGPIGGLWESLGGDRLVFSFPGLLIGSCLYSLPFAVQPLENGFRAIGHRPLEIAATLGAAPLDRFFSVVVPLARHAFLTAAILVFASTVGEFGVVLMIGGNIPGRTQVLSIALYNHVEAFQYDRAHALALGMMIFSFVVLVIVNATNARFRMPSAVRRS